MLTDKTEQEQQFHAKMLSDVKDTLDKYKLTNILSGSALLGVIRDGDLVPWQTGLVLIVFIEEIKKYNDKIKNDLIKKGFEVKKNFNNDTNWKIRVGKDRFVIEITGYFKQGDKYIRKTKKRVREVPERYLINCMNTVKLRGIDYIIPNYVEKYLEHLYGPEWRTPIKSENPSDFRAKTHCRRIDK